jgi:hypothetical protein
MPEHSSGHLRRTGRTVNTIKEHKALNQEDAMGVTCSTNYMTFSPCLIKYHSAKLEKSKQIPWLLVCKRTIPTEQSPLVGKLNASFCGRAVSHGQRILSARPLISVF